MGKNTFRQYGFVHSSRQKSALQCQLIARKIHTWLLGLDIEMRAVRVQKNADRTKILKNTFKKKVLDLKKKKKSWTSKNLRNLKIWVHPDMGQK